MAQSIAFDTALTLAASTTASTISDTQRILTNLGTATTKVGQGPPNLVQLLLS